MTPRITTLSIAINNQTSIMTLDAKCLCWVSLCWVSLCWVSLCWVSLCWASLCWVSLCWVSLCSVLLCWVSLCWISWRQIYFMNNQERWFNYSIKLIFLFQVFKKMFHCWITNQRLSLSSDWQLGQKRFVYLNKIKMPISVEILAALSILIQPVLAVYSGECDMLLSLLQWGGYSLQELLPNHIKSSLCHLVHVETDQCYL